MSAETEDLATHVSLCDLRYKTLEKRLDQVDERIAKIEDKVNDLTKQQQEGFNEIKLLLANKNTARTNQLLTTFGTLVTAILAFAGYVIVKM